MTMKQYKYNQVSHKNIVKMSLLLRFLFLTGLKYFLCFLIFCLYQYFLQFSEEIRLDKL